MKSSLESLVHLELHDVVDTQYTLRIIQALNAANLTSLAWIEDESLGKGSQTDCEEWSTYITSKWPRLESLHLVPDSWFLLNEVAERIHLIENLTHLHLRAWDRENLAEALEDCIRALDRPGADTLHGKWACPKLQSLCTADDPTDWDEGNLSPGRSRPTASLLSVARARRLSPDVASLHRVTATFCGDDDETRREILNFYVPEVFDFRKWTNDAFNSQLFMA